MLKSLATLLHFTFALLSIVEYSAPGSAGAIFHFLFFFVSLMANCNSFLNVRCGWNATDDDMLFYSFVFSRFTFVCECHSELKWKH